MVKSVHQIHPNVQSLGAADWANQKYLKTALVVTASFPLFWILGLGGAFWPILACFSLVYILKTGISPMAGLPLALVGALLLSTPIGTIAFGFQFSRLASLAGNLAVWISLAALFTLASRVDFSDQLRKCLAVVTLSQGLLIAVSRLIFPARLPFPILNDIEALGSGFGAFSRNALYVSSWLGEVAFRSAGTMAQPTWSGAFAAVGILASVPLLRHRGKWRVIAVLAILGGLVAIDLSLSRSVTLSLVGAALVGVVVSLRRIRGPLFSTTVLLSLLTLAFVALAFSDRIAGFVLEINSQRAGSLTTRTEIYSRTFELIQQLPFPLLGYGIKPQESELVASIATHSSLLGTLFRGGLLGLAVFVALFLIALWVTVRRGDGLGAALVVFIAVWCVLEDFDPGHLVPLGLVLAISSHRNYLDSYFPTRFTRPTRMSSMTQPSLESEY
jgi:O-antigen ligase